MHPKLTSEQFASCGAGSKEFFLLTTYFYIHDIAVGVFEWRNP